MSRSIHVTTKNLRGLTKEEHDEQLDDPYSDLRQWAKKSNLKIVIKKIRQTKKKTNVN
ncbi:MAG: hypothetical protein U0Y08_00410 [Bacteroidia bacterium]